MLTGTYYHKLEAKGRLAIPAKFRKHIDKGSVVTRGLDGCLFLFPAHEWERLIRKLHQSPLTQRDARSFVRLMTHAAEEVKLDSQGRTRLPLVLCQYASLKKEVVIAGTLTRIEIWDRETYHAYVDKLESEGEDLAERLGESGV